MTLLVALSVSIAVLGAIATWAFLSSWSGPILIWAAFLAWGCFFHSGGDDKALKTTIAGNALGSVVAWLTAVVILAVPLAGTLTLPVWAGLAVGLGVLVICLAAHIELFSVIPANVYGFAATFAYLLQSGGALTLDNLTSASMSNAPVPIIISMIIGAVFGLVSGKVGNALTKK